MLDVVKDLKYFQPTDMVIKWQAKGKLGKEGMKDDVASTIPPEYNEYERIMQQQLGIYKMHDLVHVTSEEIHL